MSERHAPVVQQQLSSPTPARPAGRALSEMLEDKTVIAALRASFDRRRSRELRFDLERTLDLLAGDNVDRDATMAELTSWFTVYGYVETPQEPLIDRPARLAGRMGRAVWEELSLSARQG